METKVVLCDNCKDRVSKMKCDICSADSCKDCIEKVISLNFEITNGATIHILCCRSCRLKIKQLMDIFIVQKDKEDIESAYSYQYKKVLIDYTQRILALENMEKKL